MLTTATMRVRANFRDKRLLQALIVLYVVVWVVTAIEPTFPTDWRLENLLVLVFLPMLVLTYRFLPLSDLSYLLITSFMCLHAVGAHYTVRRSPARVLASGGLPPEPQSFRPYRAFLVRVAHGLSGAGGVPARCELARVLGVLPAARSNARLQRGLRDHRDDRCEDRNSGCR